MACERCKREKAASRSERRSTSEVPGIRKGKKKSEEELNELLYRTKQYRWFGRQKENTLQGKNRATEREIDD